MAIKLEVFEDDQVHSAGGPGQEPLAEGAEFEDLRLAAFENGYRAGWDDASATREEEEIRLRDEVARTLQTLSFTYHEARSHVLRALNPLIAEVAGRLLPDIARSALPHLVGDALIPFAELAADAPVEVILHPDTRPVVEPFLDGRAAPPLVIREDPAMTAGQVWLRLGHAETRVEIDAALAAIRTVLTEFFDAETKDRSHG